MDPSVVEPSAPELSSDDFSAWLTAPSRANAPTDLTWDANVGDGGATITLGVSLRSEWREWIRVLAPATLFLALGTIALHGGGLTSAKSTPFGIVAVSVGTYLFWRTFRRKNRYRLALDGASFVVRSGPIPGPTLRKVTTDIEGFRPAQYLGVFQTRGKPYWEVRLVATDGRTTALPLPIRRFDHAGFVAAALNEILARLRQPTTYRG